MEVDSTPLMLHGFHRMLLPPALPEDGVHDLGGRHQVSKLMKSPFGAFSFDFETLAYKIQCLSKISSAAFGLAALSYPTGPPGRRFVHHPSPSCPGNPLAPRTLVLPKAHERLSLRLLLHVQEHFSLLSF